MQKNGARKGKEEGKLQGNEKCAIKGKKWQGKPPGQARKDERKGK